MKNFCAIDTKDAKRIHDVHAIEVNEEGDFFLRVAVSTKYHFYINEKGKGRTTTECIVMYCHYHKTGTLLSVSFAVEDITLQVHHTFNEFDHKLDLLVGKQHIFFYKMILASGSNMCSRDFELSAEGITECMMSMFTTQARKDFKIDCKTHGRHNSPKDKLYRIELAKAVRAKKVHPGHISFKRTRKAKKRPLAA